jgi:hypothetical protein
MTACADAAPPTGALLIIPVAVLCQFPVSRMTTMPLIPPCAATPAVSRIGPPAEGGPACPLSLSSHLRPPRCWSTGTASTCFTCVTRINPFAVL